MLARVLALGHERCNFQVGEAWTSADVERVEARIGRRLPRSWAKFFMAYGNGSFFVYGLGYYSNDAPQSESALRHFVPDDDGWGREDNFDVEFSTPDWYDMDGHQRHLCDDDEEHWLEIGSKLNGDSLILRTGEPGVDAPEEAEIAWYDHETGRRSYRWPSFASFWEHMLVLHDETPKEEKEPRGDHVIAPAPPARAPSRDDRVLGRVMLYGGVGGAAALAGGMLGLGRTAGSMALGVVAGICCLVALAGLLMLRSRAVGPRDRDEKRASSSG